MEFIIRNLKRPIRINGQVVSDVDEIIKKFKEGEMVHIKLDPLNQMTSSQLEDQTTTFYARRAENQPCVLELNRTYIIKVRQYMTQPSTPEFDFHDKWNKGVPMPFRIMQGTVLKETRGMVYMSCHATPLETDTCMRCGRRLTHPISQLYGVGPECGQHAYINPFETEEELYAALNEVKRKLHSIQWEGWIIKSAIEQAEEVI